MSVCFCALYSLVSSKNHVIEGLNFPQWEGVGVVICVKRGAHCLHMVQLMPMHPKTPSFLASSKRRLVLPFSYRLIQVVLEKKPLNGCHGSYVINVMSMWSLR